MEERVLAPGEQDVDSWQYSLRPRRLIEYIGQDQVKQSLNLVQAALARRKRLTMFCYTGRLAWEKLH